MSNKSLVKQFGAALWREVKATATPLQFPGYGGGSYQGFSSFFNLQQFFGGAYANSNQNWAAQVGDPSLSSLAMAACGWVGRRLPEARLQIIETDAKDNDEPMMGHPLAALIARPNPYFDNACLWEHFAFSWILDGNVYWLLRRDSRGRVVEIWPLPHWLVWPRWRNESEYLSAYEYAPNGRSSLYRPEEIVHFRVGVNDPDNTRKGMSPLRSILREVFSDGEIANFSATLIKNSGVPPLVVTTKEMAANLSDEEIKGFQAGLQRRISGDQRGKVLFHTWPLEVKKLSFDPEELDLRKLRFMSEERFCAVIGINPMTLHLGAASETQTYNNVESFRRQDIEDFLCPLWVRIAGTIEHQLLSQPQFSAEPGQHVRFDTTTVVALQEKENEKHERIRADVQAGLLKVKDAQMILGWPADEEMDCYLRPSGLVEIRDGEVVMAEQPEPVEPDAEEPEASEAEMEKELPETTKALKALHEFSSTQVDIVGHAAALMLKFREAIPDEDLAEDGREGNAHITTLYGLHAETADDVRVALGRAFSLTAVYGRTDFFAGEECDVVYVSVESPDMVALNKLLRGSLEHTATQDGYVPHATLARVKSGLGAKYAGDAFLRGWTDTFHVLTFVSTGGLRSQIPLGMAVKAKDVLPETNGHAPSAKEIDAAIDFWREVAPEADGLITAETIND